MWKTALAEPAKLVFLETPSNAILKIVDIESVAMLSHEAGVLVIVDDFFASPLYQKRLAFGADIVIYSTTKHADSQSRLISGAVLGKRSFVEDVFLPFYQ